MVLQAAITYWDTQRRIFAAQNNEEAAKKRNQKIMNNRHLARRKEVSYLFTE
jgi:hypothetical protein